MLYRFSTVAFYKVFYNEVGKTMAVIYIEYWKLTACTY